MRAYRKRPWTAMAVNMTPLIDVVFLIIIFFILLINFSEMHIREINLPKADEAVESRVDEKLIIPIVAKAKDAVFLGSKKIALSDLDKALRARRIDPEAITVQIRADENVPYEVIREILYRLSLAKIRNIEFSTLKEPPMPLQEDSGNEN